MAAKGRLAVVGLLVMVCSSAYANLAPEFDPSCAGLDRVQIAHPKACHEYLVCCLGKAVLYECNKQRAGDETPYPRYGTAQRQSYYNAFNGKCERFDETGASPRDVCGNANPNSGPISSDWANSVCVAKASYEKTLAVSSDHLLAEAAATVAVKAKEIGLKSKAAPGTPVAATRDSRATVVVLTAANVTAQVFADAGIEVGKGDSGRKGRSSKEQQSDDKAEAEAEAEDGGRRRALLQLPGNDVGAYEVIINPDLGRSSTGALAIHASMIPTTTKVLLWGRIQPAYEPGMFTGGTPEVSSVYDYNTGTYVKAPMRVAPFCSGLSHLADGTIMVGGGDWANSGFLTEGRYAVRTWDKDGSTWTNHPESLAYPHWYPTQLSLSDGRVLLVGGYASEADPPVPAIEIWDNRVKRVTTITPEPFLQQLGGLNLYPTTLLLPWTNAPGNNLFIMFSCSQGRIMQLDSSNNLQTLYNTPAWPTPGWCSAFSALGSATILRMDADNGFTPELAMWGGSGGDAGTCACDLPANDNAYRLSLDKAAVTSGTWAWQAEKMPGGRNMVDNVLLPNGKLLLVNGARLGNSNGGGPYGGSQARSPVYEAWMYDPYAPAGSRFKVMAASPFKRLYHSVAMLMPDANVLVMGSEQDECTSTCFIAAKNLQQFTPERFRMPYDFLPLKATRPVITGKSADTVAMGDTVSVTYTGTVTHAVIASPAAITHQTHMNQRLLKLATNDNADGSITVTMPPPGGLVVPAGWYMLFLMNGDVPCTQATWVRLDNAAAPPDAPSRAAPGGLVAAASTTFEDGAAGAVFTGSVFAGAAATFDFAAGGPAAYSGYQGAAISVTNGGTATFHIQVNGPTVTLNGAKTYTTQFQIRANTITRATALWIRMTDAVVFGETSFQVDTVFKDMRLYRLQPPATGTYQLRFEFGMALPGTDFYLDDIQVFDMTAPPSPNPLPPVNDASAALPPPPAAPVVPVGALIPAISENFNGAAPYKYTLGQFNNAAATVNYPPGGADGGSVLRATVTATGGAAWHLQLTSAFVPFQAAESYSLRLRASAAAPGGVPVGVNVLFLRETTYALLGLRTFFLSAAADTIELSPPVAPPTDGNYHVQIEFGLAPVGTVLTFDDISVYDGSLPAINATAPPTRAGGAVKIDASSTDFEGAGPFPASGAQFAGAATTFAFGAAAGAAAASTGTQGASALVTAVGTASWNLQLVGPWVPLTAGHKYTACVQARSTAPAPVTLLLLRDKVYTPFSPLVATLGAAWTTVTITDVVLPATDTYHVQIELGSAPVGTTLYFDNLELFDTTDGPAPAPPVPGTPLPPPPGGTALKVAASSTDFEGAGPFPASGAQFAGAAATFAFGAAAGAAAASTGTQGASALVNAVGTASWNLQVVGPWVPLTAGRKYTARVQARSTAPAPVTLLLLRDKVYTPFSPLVATLGAAWTTVTITDMVLPATDTYHVQIELGSAPVGTTLYFDNLELFDTTDGPAPAPATPAPGAAPGPAPAPVIIAATSENFNGATSTFAFAKFNGADLKPDISAGAARATVVTPGAAMWNLQLVGPSVQLDATKAYTISVSVSSSVATSVNLLFLREAPALAPVAPTGFAVGPAAKTMTLPGVQLPASGPYHVQFEFGLVPAGAVLTFDNVVVTAV